MRNSNYTIAIRINGLGVKVHVFGVSIFVFVFVSAFLLRFFLAEVIFIVNDDKMRRMQLNLLKLEPN